MGTVSYAMIQEVSGSLFRLIRGVVRDREEALDATQDVFVKLLGRSVEDNPAAFKGYAMRAGYHAALNAVRNHRRRERIQEQLQYEPDLLGGGSRESDCSECAVQLRRRLRGALDQLPAKQREAVEFRFYGGLMIDEIAAAMSISSGSVKVHLSRALNRLNEIMMTPEEGK